jgi:3',5'-cyclic AMP phosphodiesterase CpdA
VRPRDLASKRLLGWLNLAVRGRHRAFREAAAITAAFLEDLRAQEPDAILSTGDLTGLSLPEEFAMARAALRPLLDDPRLTGIPGNHDVYVRAAVAQRLHERSFGEWMRTDFSADDFPAALRGLHPYPLVRLLGLDAAIVCLRDVGPTALHDSTGTVGERQIEALHHVLHHPRLASRTRLLALHTSPCRAGGAPDRRLHGLRDWRQLLAVAREGGVACILHGHIHGRFVVRGWAGTNITVANPGSLTSSRHDRAYHLLTVTGGKVAIEARRYEADRGVFAACPA